MRLQKKNLYCSFRNRGEHYVYTGEYELAVQDLSKYIEFEPDYSAYAYESRAQAYNELKQYDRAVQDLNKAREIMTDDDSSYGVYRLYLARGLLYGRLKQYDLAIQDFNKVMTADPNDYASYLSRGVAYFFLKKYELAIQDLDKAIELFDENYIDTRDPDYFMSSLKFDICAMHFVRSLAHQALGKKEKALFDFAKIRKLDPTGETIHEQVEILYQQLGDKEAQDVLKKAKQLGYNG